MGRCCWSSCSESWRLRSFGGGCDRAAHCERRWGSLFNRRLLCWICSLCWRCPRGGIGNLILWCNPHFWKCFGGVCKLRCALALFDYAFPSLLYRINNWSQGRLLKSKIELFNTYWPIFSRMIQLILFYDNFQKYTEINLM